ncbi:MAG TPA: NAD(P)H-binding protein [Candidatus Obscuribacter sp.]|nr:NAD(P)H-binding protein [Candidatus Obscuribacter sp.]HND68639.1 NAD(P)H-binding protein [Candidatus Obscuribacter sp.]
MTASVLVDGASGYLGLHLVQTLLQDGFQVRALVRPQSGQTDREQLEILGAEVFVAPLAEEVSAAEALILDRAFAGADFAVHLIGSIAPGRQESFGSLHPQAAAVFAARAKQAAVKRAAIVTALGASQTSRSLYLHSKAEAEEVVCSLLGPEMVAIFRPSLIIGRKVGRRDSKLVNRYRQLIRTRPLVPLINGGKNLLEPVFVGDLTQCITAALKLPPAQGTGVFEIGGPNRVTMREFVEALAASCAASVRFLNLPYAVARSLAHLSEKISDVPVLSVDQAYLATMDNVTKENRLPSLMSGLPTDLQAALATYGSL